MVLTPSSMLPLGAVAKDFHLPEVVSERSICLYDELAQTADLKGFVIVFICNHCPYVVHIQHKIVEVAHQYIPQGIAFFAISANDADAYPQDDRAHLKQQADALQLPFAYCHDESQDTAKAYHAACTPDFYLFDSNKLCVYRGRFDDSLPGNARPVTGLDLSGAMDALIQQETISPDQHPSIGCNIKWRSH